MSFNEANQHNTVMNEHSQSEIMITDSANVIGHDKVNKPETPLNQSTSLIEMENS